MPPPGWPRWPKERTGRQKRACRELTAQTALKKAEANHREAEAQRDRAESNLYVARIGQAESSLRLYDSVTARALLDQCIPESGGPDRRGWEWSYLDRWCRPELQTVKVPASCGDECRRCEPRRPFPRGRLCGVVFRPEVRKPVVPTYVIDLKDGKVLTRIGRATGLVSMAVVFRPDGKRFAIAGNEGPIRVWESDTGRELRNLSGLAAPVRCLHWSPDGRRLASADEHGLVQIWDAETGQRDGPDFLPGQACGVEPRRDADRHRWWRQSGPHLGGRGSAAERAGPHVSAGRTGSPGPRTAGGWRASRRMGRSWFGTPTSGQVLFTVKQVG